MRLSTIIYLALTLLLPLTALANTGPSNTTHRVLYGSPTQTAVRLEMDPTTLQQRITQPRDGEKLSDGLGVILAIAGHGTPTAHVLSWEAGDVVTPTASLGSLDAAASPNELVVLGRPAVFHDLRIVSVGVRPLLRATDGSLRLVSSLTMEVTTSGAGGINEIDDPVSFSSAFYPLYRAMVSNLDEVYPEHSVRNPGRFLVLAVESRFNSFNASAQWQQWLDLKQRKGYTMQLITLPNGLASTVIQAIQTAYDDHSQPDVEYAMVVGDVPEVLSVSKANPEHTDDYSVGDNTFYTTAGNDSLPDVLGGRVSATVPSEYVTYWNKAYQYEANPALSDRRWFESLCAVAGNYTDGQTYPVTPVWNTEWARQRLIMDGCITRSDTFYFHGLPSDPHPGSYRTGIRAMIDSGVCAVLYRGWANSTEWAYPFFYREDAEQLRNGGRLPAVFSIVCGTGNFAHTSRCLGETFTTGTGTPSETRGAIAFIGATDLATNTRHNNAILSGIVSAIEQKVRSAGALLTAGKLEGWRQFPHERGGDLALAWFYVLHVFNLLGDPEIQLQICQPGEFTTTLPLSFTVGTTLVPVTITSGGQPVEGAVVTLRAQGSNTVSARRTDGLGQAWIPVNFTAAGTAQFTAWKSGYITLLTDVPININGYDPKITAINWSDGGDNLPNPGEQINFSVEIRNDGSAEITPALTIAESDPRLTVIAGTAGAPQIAPGATAVSTAFTIVLSGELYNGERPRVGIAINSAPDLVTRFIEVPVAAPDPVISALTVLDESGDISPGETADVAVTVLNAGQQAGTNLSVNVGSHDNAVLFQTATASWAGLPVGQSAAADNAIRLQVPSGVTPGRQLLLRFEFIQNSNVIARKLAFLTVGGVTTAVPTGPDAYGYYAYEDIDVAYPAHPTYSWIELDPAYGGLGATAHEVRDDTHFGMALPALFTFYGNSYDSVWICSNGWLAFEHATLPEFRNWEIPSPIGPGAMVCPFWDDMVIDRIWPNNDSLHYIWTRYDASDNRFVVQWRTFNRGGLNNSGNPNMAFCTFEAILKYRPSGDDDILFQYNEIANVDVVNNYASVGIQDSRHDRGLGLTYANTYPPSVAEIAAGRAILITTTPPDSYNDVPVEQAGQPRLFMLHEAYPNPFNPRTELRFEIPETGLTTLKVYDILGKEIATLVNGRLTAGTHQVSFDARDLPTGLYFARLSSGTNAYVRKLMFVK